MEDDFRAMFEDEARVATRLHHENVVETYDVYSDLQLCVLVMEFLDGQTLSRFRQRASKDGHAPLAVQLRIIADVLAGLHYVHELADHDGRPLGIVHRDVTPTNVFLTYDGQVKLVDFGIAKATTRLAVTRMGVLKGKLAYMSPEAARGGRVDRRSDIFSVGVMLWEAATGLRFWQDHDEIAVFRRLVTDDLPLDPAGAQIANPLLRRIVHRALAVDPRQRYDNAKEMQQDLENLLAPLGNFAQAPALSACLASSFPLERERLQKLIENAQARLSNQPASKRRLVVDESSDSCAGFEPPNGLSAPLNATFRGASYDTPFEPGEFPNPPQRRRSLILGAAAAAASVGIAVIAHAPAGLQARWRPSPALQRTLSSTIAAAAPITKPSAGAGSGTPTEPDADASAPLP
jgi:serine/threonine-protein kinase